MSQLVRFSGVSLGYHGRPVLGDIGFDISAGDFFGLVGPNGSGKTTLLRALLGVLRPLAGTITVADGVRFGYVPQREQIESRFPLMVLDVVLMGRYPRIGLWRKPSDADREVALQALERVGIGQLAFRHVGDLSGGQKQRALIARALVGDPTALVLDEPTNGLDLVATTQILGLLRELRDQSGLTVLMVSHALNEVANYVERIGLLVDGRLREGPVDEVLTEASLSELYQIPVEVASVGGHRIVLARPSHRATRGV
jgi:ABC-type Mn2+/Zn2+ transport system ATPase subunit